MLGSSHVLLQRFPPDGDVNDGRDGGSGSDRQGGGGDVFCSFHIVP